MDIEELKRVLGCYKPHVIARQTGLSKITIYNLLAGKQLNQKPDTIEKLLRFLASQQVAIATLQIKQLQ